MTTPQSPIELPDDAAPVSRLDVAADAALDATFVEGLAGLCEVVSGPGAAAMSRDWWPMAMHWALAGRVPNANVVVARPCSSDEVVAVVRHCARHGVPLTAAGGRSGVMGAAVPVLGGVLLDLTPMHGLVDVDTTSGVAEVLPGTFGSDLETALRSRGLTLGHHPQSIDISTVGGWVAARGAGQFSTRYGPMASMVHGLEVVLADGSVVRVGGAPAAATGPDLVQLFVGSEGTLGVITRVWLRVHPAPTATARSAWGFDGPTAFDAGLDACRRIIRRGATPAVLRLYDGAESRRSHGGDGSRCVLLVLDEGDGRIVDATMAIVAEECRDGQRLEDDLVERWLQHRNDTSALQALTRRGFVVDTLEVAARWSALPAVVRATTSAMMAVPHARAATCHLSHSYLDGACVYFTFAATPPAAEIEATYIAMWDVGQRAALAHGANLSHHHGVGLNRARFVPDALGGAVDVLRAVKRALDPTGVLNPGKMGLSDRPVWP